MSSSTKVLRTFEFLHVFGAAAADFVGCCGDVEWLTWNIISWN